ncbi:hypothetical protein OSB04_030259 [Centaurea solstitialis]|uniref:Myb/SANT-like domain-containing protein n=1 Tax=Centaurea solstitialis TaxID=347529 RepID=A0AA38SKA1_9ASTR|nr:hypothetical protein OSB04_030259 [Centaurea solstitialis]
MFNQIYGLIVLLIWTMGSQVPTGNDRSRTYWTPTMERYFLDLMLEHIQKGNRVGHTFNKQAWTDMLAVFNAKFGSQYDKDVLKSRYTNLWKQFNDVKTMLGQGVFSWDETRHMVVAEDYVWDSYIKAHPDARPYKTKAVQNFSDLCLIYGYTTADGRYSRSSHDTDICDEPHGANLGVLANVIFLLCSGDGLGSPTPSNVERSRTDWTSAMDEYFAGLLLGQREKGNKLDNSYTKVAWSEMLISFNEKYGPQHTKRILRHRYKKLFKYYTDMKVLLKQDGFSWDAKEKKIVAKDDVWDAYIKGHPQARSYRTKSMPNYKDLESVFGSASINGSENNNLDKGLDEDMVGSKAGNERSRTYWTPPMDRYLVDLLLDQVIAGNRIGQTFVAQAWIEMTKSFNAHFASKHDKDVLKNRYKHLKRQYNDIKTLLGETGFSWDDAREMVAAADPIWDAYIEVHPDARSYRVKTVPNYRKLCVIYGEDSSERRYSHLARNVASDVAAVSDIGESKEIQLISETKQNGDWTFEMDECFIELLLEQVHGGNKTADGFDDQIWTVITTSFNERSGSQHENQTLRNRYSYFMKQFNEVECLLKEDGFSWDDTCQVIAANDEAWEAYIKEHPQATSYKGMVLRHHKDFLTIFGGNTMHEGLTTDSDIRMGTETVEVGKNSQILPKETETSNKKQKRVTETPLALGRGGKVQKSKKDDIREAFTDMANVVSKLVNGKAEKNYVSIERAVDALQAIPDLDDDLLLDGCDILEDEKKAKTFLALDASLRKKWLLRKLGR